MGETYRPSWDKSEGLTAMGEGLTCYLVGFAEDELLSFEQTLKQHLSLPTPLHIMSFREKKELATLPSSHRGRQLLILSLEDLSAPRTTSVFPGNLDVLWFLALRNSSMPWVATTRTPENFPESMCLAMGALAYVAKPASHMELVREVKGALQAEPRPSGRKIPLFMMLQIAHAIGMSAVLKITSNLDADDNGFIGLKDGEVFYARSMNGSVGESALVQFLSWPDASFEVKRTHDFLRGNISTPLANILLSFSNHALNVTESTDVSRAEARASVDPTEPADVTGPPMVPFLPTPTEENALMANLNQVCQDIVSDVMDSVACGVVDLNTGMLMGIHHTVPYFTQSYLDAVAAAAVDMFRGRSVRRVEQLLSKHRGTPIQDSFNEIFISSTSVFHFMKIIPEKGAVVVLITKKTTNQGMGWAGLRGGLSEVTDALP